MNIKELYNTQKKNVDKNNKIYADILNMCYNTIKKFNNYNKFECFYNVPPFIIGLPLYNYTELITYIVMTLRSVGYHSYWDEKYRHIYISWKPEDIDYNKFIDDGNRDKVQLISTEDNGFKLSHPDINLIENFPFSTRRI
jgi:hypothetical protein